LRPSKFNASDKEEGEDDHSERAEARLYRDRHGQDQDEVESNDEETVRAAKKMRRIFKKKIEGKLLP